MVHFGGNGGNVTGNVLLVDSSTLWLLAGGLALVLGIVGFGINYNIRRSRDATEKQTRELTQELERLRSASGAKMGGEDPEKLRKEALREALRREPDLADTSDDVSRQRLSELVEQISRELQIQREVAKVKQEETDRLRRLEAERELARKLEEGKKKAEEAKRQEEEARLANLRDREQRLAQMSPLRRWLATHKGVTIGGCVGILAVLAISGLAINANIQSSRLAAERAEAAASAAAEREADAQDAAERDELIESCDLTRLKAATGDPFVLVAWTKCDDPEVAVKAASELWLVSPERFADVRFDGMDLSGLDLQGVNLPGARFDKANLSGANLAGGNFTSARFFGANLAGADLTGANLEKASLTDADLSGANLAEANLSLALMVRTNLTDANLDGTNLEAAFWRDVLCANGEKLDFGYTTSDGKPPC